METTNSYKKKYQEPSKVNYVHRAFYVFFVLLGLNLIWDIFVSVNESPKHFFMGIVVIASFAVFYFIIKNLKRLYIKRYSVKSKFLDSTTLVPFIYIASLFLFLIFSNLSTYFSQNIAKVSGVNGQHISAIGTNKDNNDEYDNNFESDLRNTVFFMNISMCKYASFLVSVEHPELLKKYNKENIINKKWVVTTKMIFISLLCTFIMQVIAINVAERIIFKSVRRKKKGSPHRKNKVVTQTA